MFVYITYLHDHIKSFTTPLSKVFWNEKTASFRTLLSRTKWHNIYIPHLFFSYQIRLSILSTLLWNRKWLVFATSTKPGQPVWPGYILLADYFDIPKMMIMDSSKIGFFYVFNRKYHVGDKLIVNKRSTCRKLSRFKCFYQ